MDKISSFNTSVFIHRYGFTSQKTLIFITSLLQSHRQIKRHIVRSVTDTRVLVKPNALTVQIRLKTSILPLTPAIWSQGPTDTENGSC